MAYRPEPRTGLLLARLLLAGHGLRWALAGTRVGARPLAAHRQATAVPDALVAADLHLAADVGRHLAAEITLDLVVGLDEIAQLHDLVVAQIPRALARADPGRFEALEGAGAA